ncbi:unnamed protein product [Phaedon cochleariae]|uniref:NACHT domain-containing protein n=1 Tax=Phaedon cochleariae TaxID=80249 RepID=A0A9P0DQ20_PHACE|nr:unnamed protein product [Phaedon cochleariae]
MANNDAGRGGTEYQMKVFALIALQAFSSRHHEKWILSIENELAGKFDDVVFESENGRNDYLIQCKHKRNRSLFPWKHLLPKYYNSYKELIISGLFKPKLLILCSNIGPSDGDFFDTELMKIDIFPGETNSFKFKSSKVREVQGILEASDNHSKNFCEKFRFFHIDDSAIEDGIKIKLEDAQHTFGGKFSKLDFMEKIDKCFQGKLEKKRRIGKSHVIAFLYDWRSQDYLGKLDSFGINFKQLYTFGKQNMINIVAVNDHFLNLLKIHRSLLRVDSPTNNGQLYKKDQLLFIDPSVGSNILEKIIVSFELPGYCILVISLNNSNQFRIIQSRLYEILNNDKKHYKKVIILSKVPIQNDVIEDEIKFTDLTEACQTTLLSKSVNFQEKDLPIHQLLNNSVSNIDLIIDQKTIIDLIYGEHIKIGAAIRNLGEIEPYYMERKFILSIEDKTYEFTEQDVCNSVGQPGKFVLISDGAGMGKTTILTKLGCLIKDKYPSSFLIRVDLNMFTSIFKKFQKAGIQSIDLEEILRSKDKNYLKNSFEQTFFSNTRNIILMIDAVDEISPNYTSLVQNFILKTSECENIFKIFVTTRPHLTRQLESILNTRSYRLLPYSTSEQTDFLKKYWRKNLRIDDEEKLSKCEIFAEKLICKLGGSIGNTSWNLIGIPLQTRMIAEIFQGSDDKKNEWMCCKDFLLSEEKTLELPDQLNVTKLYDMFVEKKGEIFIEDKCNTQGNVTTEEIVSKHYEDAKNEHQKLAARLLLKDRQCSLMNISKIITNSSKETIIRMGMLQEIGDELLFVHQTFAEYFLAKAIWTQLKGIEERNEYLMFLMENVFINGEFEVVRAFLESILANEYPSIPKEVFEICGSTVDNINWHESKNINHLAKEGRKNILKLILEKSQNSKDVFENHIFSTNNYWRSISSRLWLRMINRKKILEIVDETTGRTILSEALKFQEIIEFLLDKGADVNQRDKQGRTILHYAAGACKIELVKYLVNRGATINVPDIGGETPLLRSVDINSTELFFYFIENGADVNAKSGETTPLHCAVIKQNFEIVEELLKRGANIHDKNDEGGTALHWAAFKGTVKILNNLLEKGAKVNDQDIYGDTPLHWAAEQGHLDCLKILVDSGGDVDIQNKKGQNILDIAFSFKRDEIIRYLHDRPIIEKLRKKYGIFIE